MTLLDAPKYDEAREKRHQVVVYSAAATFLVLLVACWLLAGRPVDWPWNWWMKCRSCRILATR